MKVITFVLLAIFVLLCMQNNYIVDAGNIRGTPSNTEEDVSPTSNAKGISDFRPKPHSPEDVTEENIRNKPPTWQMNLTMNVIQYIRID